MPGRGPKNQQGDSPIPPVSAGKAAVYMRVLAPNLPKIIYAIIVLLSIFVFKTTIDKLFAEGGFHFEAGEWIKLKVERRFQDATLSIVNKAKANNRAETAPKGIRDRVTQRFISRTSKDFLEDWLHGEGNRNVQSQRIILLWSWLAEKQIETDHETFLNDPKFDPLRVKAFIELYENKKRREQRP